MKKLAIIFGGRSCEHDISIITGMYIFNAINLNDYDKMLVYFYQGKFYVGEKLNDIESYIKFKPSKHKKVIFSNGCMYSATKRFAKICKIDCALLCTHGGEGEDGALQGYLEVNDIPYTSTDVSASSLTMDKTLTKKMLEAMGYNTLPYEIIKKGQDFSLDKIISKLDYPIIIKPAKLGSSIGISVAQSQEQAVNAIEVAFEYDNKLLIEKCLQDYLEINCAAVKKGNNILVSLPERLMSDREFLSYNEKYLINIKLHNNREYPAKVDKEIIDKIQEFTKRLYADFDLMGVVRIDYLLKEDDIYVNEINTIPGSLSHYLFSKLDVSVSELVHIMIKQAKINLEKKKKLINCFNSQVLKHYKENKTLAKK